MGHSRLSPSGADIWYRCPAAAGFLLTRPLMPDRAGRAAAVGTVKHDAIAGVLQQLLGEPRPDVSALRIRTLLVTALRKGMPEEEWLPVELQVFGAKIAAIAATVVYNGGYAWVERKMAITDIAIVDIPGRRFPQEHVRGTADVIVIDKQGGLTVIDWKCGALDVDPDSLQFAFYALGAIKAVGKSAAVAASARRERGVAVEVVQPRHSREPVGVSLILEDTLKGIDNTPLLVDSSLQAVRPGDRCRFCRHLGCHARANSMGDITTIPR